MAGPVKLRGTASDHFCNSGVTENTCIFLRKMNANFQVQLARVLYPSHPTQCAWQQKPRIRHFWSLLQDFNVFRAEACALEVAQVTVIV